ncbi:T9SS type B sorting domain-containing protein [Tamlana sp. I1]|uniref:T9SS type B sorting domain-containing protein n=1 Tax=Tamlana sp. I1 TaxID=2762061 RepID=UPI00188DFFAA|nr:T9SS type B sorting domain-containing protein [Tamlana sp. I1]
MNKTTCLTFKNFLSRKFLKANTLLFAFKRKNLAFIILLLFAFAGHNVFAQDDREDFTPRLDGGNIKVKGDIVLIGNGIIEAEGLPLPYNGDAKNNDYAGEYINVANGGDSSIFSSSSADLAINNECKNIVYAGLYWSAVYPNEEGDDAGKPFSGTPRIEDWNNIKFRLPTGGFIDLTADNDPDPVGEEDEIIFDGYDYNNINNSVKDSPYVCYKNVTNLLKGLVEADGTYTVANVRATRGWRNGGCSAGWTLVVIYESPSLPSKFISTFDGYVGVGGSSFAEFDVSGFQTLPYPLPVKPRLGVAALEGDLDISGDSFQFKASTSTNFTKIFDDLNQANNFFNAKITDNGVYMNNRNPNSQNTLGFDINHVTVRNEDNLLLPNDATAGTLKLTTTGDGYGAFFTSFAVDIIEPKIVLTKEVHDENGNRINGDVVQLDQYLRYVIGFENIGNDDARNMTIRDVLPANIKFDEANMTVPAGVTYTYDSTAREIVFTVVDESLIEYIPDTKTEIFIPVRVVESCEELTDACSNVIQNQAFTTYEGVTNAGFVISDDPSYDANISDSCLLGPQATNYLGDISNCTFKEDVILCGDSIELVAPGGYDSYQWSNTNSFNPGDIIGTSQRLEVTTTGSYFVRNIAADCDDIDKEFEVSRFGANVTNPAAESGVYDKLVQCADSGDFIPYIFLCGVNNGGRTINTNLPASSTGVVWEKFDASSSGSKCFENRDDTCPYENSECNYTQVATTPNFTVTDAGEYRITINYPGGCFNRFFFNVYTNLLDPRFSKKDIICNQQGEITVENVPSGYEYSLDNSSWQPGNTISVPTAGLYDVYIRQIDVDTNPCLFLIEDIEILEYTPELAVSVTNPLCHGGDKGSIVASVNFGLGQYKYRILQGGVEVNSTAPIDNVFYTFNNLNAGDYTIEVTLDSGCVLTRDVTLTEPDPIVISVDKTNITCNDGEISITATGGTGTYSYSIDNGVNFDLSNTFPIDTAGTYDIIVIDDNNCSETTSVTVDLLLQPVFTMENTGISCYGDNSGSITFNVTNANGYTLEYSIDNGANYLPNNTFSNLTPGTYQTILKYSLLGEDCYSPVEAIIIDQPDDALTASAGVSHLAGCGMNGEGTLRITNPQGGIPPYEYSFDDQSTWISDNFAEVMPGTYTVYIRDSSGCIYAMPGIVLDPEPVPPTIDDNVDPEYNCDGTANASVNVTNNGGANFEYTYLLNGVENTNTADPTTFLNVPSGSHTITVTYKLLDAPTYSNLLYETFGYGDDVRSPGINTSFYCWERQVAATQCGNDYTINDGQYSVTENIEKPFGTWLNPDDHTTPSRADGRILVVNIGDQIPEQDVLYKKTINDIIPNQPINAELFAINLIKTGVANHFDPNLTIALVDAGGNEISSFQTGDIPKSEQWENYPKTPVFLNPGNNTTLDFIVRSSVQQVTGNDVAIDDIRVYQLPISCIDEVSFPIIIESGKAFTADVVSANDVDCFGANNGEIQISATNFNTTNGYQYSIDGSTWNTVTTSPHTITGLGPDTYDVQIRYDATSTGCEFKIEQEITEPTEIDLTLDTTQATCTTDASIEATVTGGTPPYTIELLDTAGTVVDTFPNSGTLTGVASGDYQVRVTDANSCSPSGTVNVTIDAVTMPTATVTIARDCVNHAGGAKISMLPDNTTGKAPFSFRYDRYDITGTNLLESTTYNASKEFNNVPVGVYHIYMIDKNGCEVLLPITTVEEPVTISAALVKDIDCSNTPDAQIEVTIADGYPDYDYEVSFNGGNFTSLGTLTTAGGGIFTYTATAAGTYQFRVFDAITGKNCNNVSAIITVSAPETPDFTTNKVDITCAGADDGQITISPTAGAYDFEYSIDGGTNYQTSATFNNLAAGIYDVIIIDGKECVSVIKKVEILEPDALSVSASATTLKCDTNNVEQAAVVTIDVPTTGTSPYQYSFNGSGFSNTRTLSVYDNGSVQSITYSVRDANGCTAGGTLDIQPLDSPTDLTFTNTEITCETGKDKSTVEVTSTGGVGPLVYEISNPASATSNTTGRDSGIFTGLDAGTYVFKVTDANGCFYTKSYTVAALSPIALIARKLSDVNCFGGDNGAIELEVSGGSGTYSYQVSTTDGTAVPGQTDQTVPNITLPNLEAGTYTILVTDKTTKCPATSSVTINQPTAALSLTATATNIYCSNDESQITVVAADGTPNYKYAAVVTGATAPTTFEASNVIIVDTNSGTNLDWDVYVQDANDCIEKTTVKIATDAAPTVSVTTTPNSCDAVAPYTFTATPGTGSVAPLEYSINGGASYQTSATFTINTAGDYKVTIKDGNGCTAETDIKIFSPLTASAILTKDITCSATPTTDAVIEIPVSGGNSPYFYEVSTDGGSNYSGIAAPSPNFTVATVVSATTYQFRITDDNGCIVETGGVTVNPAEPVTVATTNVDPTCNGSTDGSIQLEATTGEAPFEYSMDNGVTFVSTNVFGGLAAGTYSYVVRDSKGCTFGDDITLTEPPVIDVTIAITDIQCDVAMQIPGELEVTINSGGVADFDYILYDHSYTELTRSTPTSATTHIFNNLGFGDYYVVIIDATGCEYRSAVQRIDTPPALLLNSNISTGTCATGAEVEISITNTTNPDYTYQIFGDPSTAIGPIAATSHTFTGLDHGVTFFFQVTDARGCYSVIEVTTPPSPSGIAISNVTPQDANCFGNADGSLMFDVSGYDGSVTALDYEVRDAFSNLPVSPAIDGSNIAISATGTTSIGVTGIPAGNYLLWVKETDGTECTATAMFQISQPTQALTSSVTNNINANCNSDALITLTTTGGTGPYQYAAGASGFTPIASDFDSNNVLSLDPNTNTTWDIVVRDANGCEFVVTESISVDPLPTVKPVDPYCFDGTPFTITIEENSSSPISPFKYSISTTTTPGGFSDNQDFLITAAGTYHLFVKDNNGCIARLEYIVNPPLILDAEITKEIDCTGTPNAEITLTATGGDTSSAYVYAVSTDGGLSYMPASNPYSAVAGSYIFRVTDAQAPPNACQATSQTVVVVDADVPTLSATHTDVSCNGGSDGSIIVTATAGVAPFEYSIDNGATFQASNVFNGSVISMPAGTYQVVVKDAKDCESAPVPVIIDEPSIVVASVDNFKGLNCGTGNATEGAEIVISGSGGTAPYTFSFNGSNFTTEDTYQTNFDGTVSVIVKDANDCISALLNVVIDPISPPTDLDFVATTVTCNTGELTSNVTLTPNSGAVGPFDYNIIYPTAAAGGVDEVADYTFTGLAPDTYTFEVIDANGCNYTESFTVDPAVNIFVAGIVDNDVSCFGIPNGKATFTATNVQSTFTARLTTGTGTVGTPSGNTVEVTDLAAGTYTLEIEDTNTGCTATADVTITQPTAALALTASATNVHCNNYFSQITVTATGGTPSYSYAAVTNGSPAPAATDYALNASVLTVDTNNGTQLDWDVYVQDANGCTEDTTVSITLETMPTVTAPAIATCATPGGGYEFTVSGAGGVLPYEYSVGNGFQSSPTFTGLTPGTYTVTIKDANGCEGTSAAVTVYDNLEVYTSISAQPSCAGNDGEINVTATGGSGNYSYAINPNTGITATATGFTGLTHSTAYMVTVTDTDTNCTSDASVTLEAPIPVTFTTDVTNVTCNGGNDGVIEVLLDANQDNPIYSFEIIGSLNNGTTVPAQASNVFSGLAADTYTVQVTSGRGCMDTQDVTVGESAAIAVPAPTVVQYACLADTNSSDFATITVDATAIIGGSGNYVFYEFVRGTTTVQDSTNPVYTETDLAGGSYTINVYDNNGCVGSTTTTIDPFVAIDDLDIAVSNAITCISDEEITISVTASGTATLEYRVQEVQSIDVNGNPVFGGYDRTQTTSGTFTDLAIGNYLITVQNTDTGCFLRDYHYVSDPNTFDVTIDNVVDVTCLDDADGSVDVTFIDRAPLPTNEAGAFTYNVVDVLGSPVTSGNVADAGPTTITGLASGTYTITATLDNTPFCEVVKNFTISGPTAALAIQETHTEITCIGNDGTISVTATGGWPGGYEYQLELGATVIAPFSATSSFTGLDAGDYTVSVRDSGGCEVSTPVQLVDPTPISATATVDINPLSCFGDTNATITVSTPTGGQGSNYTYTINRVLPSGTSSGPQLSNVFSGLGAGTYNVTVNDGWNCSFTTADVVITEPTSIQADLALTRSQTCLTSSELTLTVSGGTAPYQYSADPTFMTSVSTIFDPNVVIPVGPGTYQYYVRDANGCATGISNEIKIDPLPPLTVDAQATNTRINCYGDNTGSIIAEAKGGLGNYVYTLRDGAGLDITPAPTQNTPGEFTELVAGDYQVFVTSGDCDVMSSLITISQPDMPLEYTFAVTDVMCSGGDDGILEITATGGTGIIKYAISPQLNQFFETSTFEDLPVGNYQAIVQDELGCFEVFDFTIGEPTPVILNIVPNSIVPEICAGDLDGAFSVDITGGTPPYSVTLDDINGNYVTGTATQTQFDFTGLAGGDHIVYVMDAQGCESEWNVSFPESVNLDPQVSVTYDCVSNLSTNTVTVTIDSSIQDPTQVEYALNGGAFQTSNIFVDVPSGVDQYIDVRHSNGCIKQTPLFDIDHIDPLELVLEDGELNQIVAVATGGVAPFEYALNGGSFGSSEKFLIYASGDYTVTVRDSNGCEASATRYFEFIDVCIPNYFTPNADGNQDGWGPGCTTQYKDLIVHVFDRYGRKLADLKVDEKWDGNYNGKELPTGDYWYIVKLNDPYYDKEFVGHFTLYR